MKVLYFALLGLVLAITGCAVLDSVAGVGQSQEQSGLVEGVSKVVSSLPGWLGVVGTLLGGLFGLYKTYRERQLLKKEVDYTESIRALVAGIDKALVQGTKPSVTKEELYATLDVVKKEMMANPDFLTQLVASFKALVRKQ